MLAPLTYKQVEYSDHILMYSCQSLFASDVVAVYEDQSLEQIVSYSLELKWREW